jgi:hypothetical protein
MLQMHINKESRIFLAQNPISVRNLSVFTENINRPILSDSPEKKSCKFHPMPQNPLLHLIESQPGTTTSTSYRTCGQSIHSKSIQTLIIYNNSFFQN